MGCAGRMNGTEEGDVTVTRDDASLNVHQLSLMMCKSAILTTRTFLSIFLTFDLRSDYPNI